MHRRGIPERSDRGARLFRHLARAEELERSRASEPRRRAGGDATRASGRSQPRAEPLHRGGDLRDPRRQHVRAQRQSVAGAEVRLQARLARPAARCMRRTCSHSGVPGAADRRLQRDPDRRRTSTSPSAGLKDALFAPEAREKYRELVGQGWTDAIRHLHPGRAHLHLLALLAELVRARRRHPHRPCAAEPEPRQEPQGRWRRPDAARVGKDQRPRADLGRVGSLNCNCWPKERFDV